jgi:hypothetical protein
LTQKLQQLVGMGFGEGKCLQALFDNEMSVQGSIEQLLSQA